MGATGKTTRSTPTSKTDTAVKHQQYKFALKLEADFKPASLPVLVLDVLESYSPAWFGPVELRESVWRISPDSKLAAIRRAVNRLVEESAIETREVWGTYYRKGKPFNHRVREIRFKEEE